MRMRDKMWRAEQDKWDTATGLTSNGVGSRSRVKLIHRNGEWVEERYSKRQNDRGAQQGVPMTEGFPPDTLRRVYERVLADYDKHTSKVNKELKSRTGATLFDDIVPQVPAPERVEDTDF